MTYTEVLKPCAQISIVGGGGKGTMSHLTGCQADPVLLLDRRPNPTRGHRLFGNEPLECVRVCETDWVAHPRKDQQQQRLGSMRALCLATRFT